MSTEFPSSLHNISIDSPQMRHAGRDLLSLALMDARNHSLFLFSQFENVAALATPLRAPPTPWTDPPLWQLGHVGWFQEYWVGRHLQRNAGLLRSGAGDAPPARLASIEPLADGWWDDATVPPETRWTLALPDVATTRAYLLETLETTLDLLARAGDDDVALDCYRLCLFHEDLHSEALAVAAQTLGVPLPMAAVPAMATRSPVRVPATRWRLGTEPGGFALDNERPAHEVAVPEFEIDAQPVSWAQFVEFVDDGGYDTEAWWSPPGWAWLQREAGAEGRRGPRFVEQIGVASGAVMQTRFGRATRMSAQQPAMHLTWWEAEAWARWAGRRLPSEVEWELAAHTAARRGFHWGDVWEWTGTTFRAYPGFVVGAWQDYSLPAFGHCKAVRGASFATRSRMKQPRFRAFHPPGRDDFFVGFRTCAL